MGTGGPPVTVRAATLAGGEKNQDRYAYGDGWAFVLDGASSFATVQPEHDGGWYAERLKNALVHELTSHPKDTTVDIVARAIKVAASAHEDPATCPTSTVAMARWSADDVEVYVLGDSSAVLIDSDGEHEVIDSRMADIAPETRAEYRSRQADGHGFDEHHTRLLRSLQAKQAEHRNRDHGYWIAGADPSAAYNARVASTSRRSLQGMVLATDGAAAGIRYGAVASWTKFLSSDLHEILAQTQRLESNDSTAAKWPRSKLHDDKTAVALRCRPPLAP